MPFDKLSLIMKILLKSVLASLLGFIILLFAINTFYRVSDGSDTYGYIEELVLGKSIKQKILELRYSKNYILLKDINKRAFDVADLLEAHGKNIVEDKQLDYKRLNAINSLEVALKECDLIPDDYIKNSNPELCVKYRSHFQHALQLWYEGLRNKDSDTILMGINEYNLFLKWIQASDRNNFKRMR